MAMRLFLMYLVVELAVIVALASTIGFGWTVLALLGTFVVGLALAGSQVKRHLRRLQSGLTAATVQGAAADSVLVALGTVLVVIPGSGQLRSGCAVAAAADPRRGPSARHRDGRATDAAGRRGSRGHGAAAGWGYDAAGRGDYIDGEVVDVVDVEPHAVERKLRAREEHENPE